MVLEDDADPGDRGRYCDRRDGECDLRVLGEPPGGQSGQQGGETGSADPGEGGEEAGALIVAQLRANLASRCCSNGANDEDVAPFEPVCDEYLAAGAQWAGERHSRREP